jgi:hypothetical protein
MQASDPDVPIAKTGCDTVIVMRISSYGGESELESPYLPLIVHGDPHAIG